jgi:hypothetical protein
MFRNFGEAGFAEALDLKEKRTNAIHYSCY